MTDKRRREIPMIGVREFRDRFTSIDQTVKVIRSKRPYIEVIGTWTPNPNRHRDSDEPVD